MVRLVMVVMVADKRKRADEHSLQAIICTIMVLTLIDASGRPPGKVKVEK
jgi:hypothetical protein